MVPPSVTGMDVVRSLFDRMEARDWAGVGELLAEGVVYELPQTRERVIGRDAYLDFCRAYPEGWHLRVHRVVAGAGGEVAVWVHALDQGRPVDNLAFLTLDEQGLVTRFADFWPEPYERPPHRPPGIERY